MLGLVMSKRPSIKKKIFNYYEKKLMAYSDADHLLAEIQDKILYSDSMPTDEIDNYLYLAVILQSRNNFLPTEYEQMVEQFCQALSANTQDFLQENPQKCIKMINLMEKGRFSDTHNAKNISLYKEKSDDDKSPYILGYFLEKLKNELKHDKTNAYHVDELFNLLFDKILHMDVASIKPEPINVHKPLKF